MTDTTAALTKTLNKSLQLKSLADLVRVKTSEQVFLLIDCSGSMNDRLHDGKTRISALRDVVRDIQKQRATRMICFPQVQFVEAVPDASGGTPLHTAIRFAKTANAGRAVVISDGMPDFERDAMEAAKEFGGQIDVVFVGNPGEFGEAFLKSLAEATGGSSFTGDLGAPKELTSAVVGLLTGNVDDDEDDDE